MATLGATMLQGSKGRASRFTFVAMLPPMFICGLFVTIWSTYGIFHLHPTLFAEDSAASLGHWLLAIFSQYLTVMAFITYGLAVFTPPGSVPDEAPWRGQDPQQPIDIPQTRETKFSSGHRRYCKWCRVYKPDRTHHCRLCNVCVLRMDHHCPWIMNCVGFRNHKYFLLLVIHSWAACLVYMLTLLSSLQRAQMQDIDQHARFFTVLCMTFAGIMLCGLAAFLLFHMWLTFKGMTTIEFCEKSVANGSRISYSKGIYENLKAVFGDKPWLWLLPIGLPSGDGLYFGDAQDERTTLSY